MEIVLQKGNGWDIAGAITTELKKINDDCQISRKIASAPCGMNVTVETVELRFKHRVQLDIMYIHGRPVIHMVNEVTHCSAASFFCNP